jgi:hypothetical protein
MKKTVFVGRVNDQEFDNVQDYNACVQAMMDMGKDFQATSSTQVVEVGDEDDCECTCSGKDECCKCNHAEKPLKPVTAMLPAFESREGGKYIDTFIGLEEDKYDEAMDNLDVNLNEVYNRVSECIPHNTPEQLEVYANAVRTMIDTLERDMEKTTSALGPVNKRIEELEAELNGLCDTSTRLSRAEDVIGTYGEFYEAVEGLLVQRMHDVETAEEPSSEPESCEEVTDEQIAEVTQKLTSSFTNLLREIFGK